jgi:hypothetical protein
MKEVSPVKFNKVYNYGININIFKYPSTRSNKKLYISLRFNSEIKLINRIIIKVL